MWTVELHTYAHKQEHLHISPHIHTYTHKNITNVSKFRKLMCNRIDETKGYCDKINCMWKDKQYSNFIKNLIESNLKKQKELCFFQILRGE